MSFCGTQDINQRFRMFGFYLHCEALAHKLFDLKHKHEASDNARQIRLFQLTMEDREDFAKFAANLRFFITPWTNERSAEYWQESAKQEYSNYEFHKLFDPFQRDKSEAVIALLERVGNGEALTEEELKTAVEFLRMLGARAHSNIDHGGCF
jgi:hypothetical protein